MSGTNRLSIPSGSCLASALLALTVGCAPLPLSQSELFLSDHGRSTLLVLDAEGRPLGAAAVVRVTREEVYAALAIPADSLPPDPRLALGESGVTARVLEGRGMTVLAARRAGRDLRVALPGQPPLLGAEVVIVSATRGPWIDLWTSETLEGSADEILLGSPSPVAQREATAPTVFDGAPVFSLVGNLLGFVVGRDDTGRLVVAPADRLAGSLLELCGVGGGAEVLAEDDAEFELEAEVVRFRGLPTIADEWGTPDFDLLLEIGGRQQEPLKVEGGRVTLVATDPSPVVAQLVERDVGLFDGDVREEVAYPVRLAGLRRRTILEFDLLGRLHERYPDMDLAVRPEIELSISPRDPDRVSGPDQAALGAAPAPLRRAVRGDLDRAAGDATDHWTVELDRPGEVWCALLRPVGVRLGVQIYPPGLTPSLRWRDDDGTPASLPPARTGPAFGRLIERTPLVSRGAALVEWPPTGSVLSIGRASLPAGRSLLRVRAAPGTRATRYSLLLVETDDPEALVRALFRLISRESQLGNPALTEPDLVEQVAAALELDAALETSLARRAILAELGHRTPVVRRLALGLLEVHFPPEEQELKDVARSGSGARARDAELLLALRGPVDARSAGLVRRLSGDPDPYIRMRAVVVAGTIDDPQLRGSLLDLFEADPSAMIQRTLARTRAAQ